MPGQWGASPARMMRGRNFAAGAALAFAMMVSTPPGEGEVVIGGGEKAQQVSGYSPKAFRLKTAGGGAFETDEVFQAISS